MNPFALEALAQSRERLEIHRVRRNADPIRDAEQRCRMYNWHCHKHFWTKVDIVIARKTGRVSFDLRLVADALNFEFVKDWRKDRCLICSWELFESASDGDHGIGYTNGRDWLCTECYAKFWERQDFIASSYSDIS